jgi:putative thioredoxin
MPVLAKLADEYGGKFMLGKLNTEEEQEIAGQFGIRSIPTVKLVKDGQLIDEFMGALPEGSVREFLDRHLGRESDSVFATAEDMLRSGNTDGAIEVLKEAAAADPDNTRIPIMLAEAQAMGDDIAAAQATIDSLPPDVRDAPQIVSLRSRLYFAGEVTDAPDSATLEARLDGDADDHEARYTLALQKVVEGDVETAMELLLELMRKDREYGDDAGRKGLLRVFDLLGNDPLVGQYRRRMASLLH